MRLITIIRQRLRALWSAETLDAEAREELRQHFEAQVRMHEATGLSAQDARRAAAVDIGGLRQLEEACRDARGLAWWDALRADIRYAVRQIRRRPGYAAAGILILALGVGATTAVFTVVDAVVLRQLPYQDADRLYSLYEINSRASVGRTRATPLNFLDWQEQARSFSGMAAHIGNGFTLTGRADPAFVLGQIVTPNMLDLLGVRPALGRAFLPHEAEAGNHRVVILTHGLWQRYYGGDPAIVGQTVTINGQPHLVAGVMPASFAFPDTNYELLAPFVTKGAGRDLPPINRFARYLRVIGRLAPGVSEEEARRELDVIGSRLAQAYPETNETVTIGFAGLTDDTVGDADERLMVVLAAVAVVLLTACINVAGLAIARGSARARELAVRAAIGASQGRLVRQLATESMVIFSIGGTLGLVLAGWGVGALAPELPETLPRAHEIAVNWRFAVFGAAITLIAGLLFSVLPALNIARKGPAADLAGGRGSVSASRAAERLRGSLIVAQIAAAIVLLSGAALAVRSFTNVWRADAGFDASRAVTFGVIMRDQQYPAAADMTAFVHRVTDAMNAIPGVEAAGITTHLPLNDNNFENSFAVDGFEPREGEEPPLAAVRAVAGNYRAALGARLLQGRDLQAADTATSQPVVIVTESFIRRYVHTPSPIGARLRMGGPDDPWRTIVGVIADIRHNSLDQAPRPEVWFPYTQMDGGILTTWLRGAFVAARTSTEPAAAMPSLRAAMRQIDSSMPLLDPRPLAELAHTSTAERRLETLLLLSFAVIATLLAAVGLFGILAFHVGQHVQEFGLRLALGATPSGLMRLVIRRGLLLIGLGVVLGVPGALAMGRGMSALLYGVEPADPLALGGAALMLSAVTLIACAVPARRAMNTDPLVALRSD